MARTPKPSVRKLEDQELADRLQSILINTAQGQRSVSDDRQYGPPRRELMRRSSEVPSLLNTHPTLNSFSAYVTGIPDRNVRVERVRAEFDALNDKALKDPADHHEASDWTGLDTKASRLRAVKNLIPLAQSAVEGMISALSEPGGNNGPLLDHREEALVHLRALHEALGKLLTAADEGHFEDELGQGFAAEASRFAKRAARALRDDPMPYIAQGLLVGVLSACGVPGLGEFLGGIAGAMKKSAAKDHDRT
jgi:hypothetical protein